MTHATGTITRTIFDARGLTTETWIGTDDEPTSGFWSPTNNVGANMVQTAEFQYDGGADGGDGNLTQVTQIPGGSAADRVSQMFYDWRNRRVATKSAVEASESTGDNRHFIQYVEYDNRNQPTANLTYDGDTVTIADANSDGVPDAPSASLLRAKTTSALDDHGRVFRSTVFSVDPASGSVSSTGLVTETWRDHRGNVIKAQSPGAAAQKFSYDGAGRMAASYVTDASGDSAWSDADDVTGDAVLEQTESSFDANGNVLLTTRRARFHDETGTGALGTAATGVKARVSYQAGYFDDADRLTHSVDVGTNGGSAYTRPCTPPSRSDTELVTSFSYDVGGRMETVTDPGGLATKAFFDLLGRTAESVANYVDGTPSDADDQTTAFTHNGLDQTLTVKAILPGSAIQETEYVYGASQSRGDALDSNNLQVATRYPDKSTGAASASEEEPVKYNALGERTSYTDRNGSTHNYSYDVLGHMTADTVTTLGAGVDGAVRRIGYSYNTQGLVEKITSYSDTAGTTIVNEIQREYNGLGQIATEYQAHAGAVNTGSTPKVQYAYSLMSGGDNHSRLTSITYPNGRVIGYNYTSGTDDAISRLSSLSDSSATLESYTYLGLATVVTRAHAESGVDLSYIKLSGESTGDGGDQYTGLDRFGRVADQRWLSGTTDKDRYQYGYDRDANRLYRENLLDSALSELYDYDGLNRVTTMERGTLDGTKTALAGSASRSQSWDLDALGNSDGVTTDGVNQARTHNAQNQLTQVGAGNLAFDANGNLTTDQNGKTLRYDAWNRLVEQKNGATGEIAYKYDGLGRRITEGTTEIFFTTNWQAVEERNASNQTAIQYVWSPVYVDAMILRDRDTNSDGTLDERLYVTQDANWNVTALISTSGAVLERFQYDAYGKRTVLDASWSPTADAYSFQHGHQGGKLDGVTGRINFRNRDYDTDLMRWIQQDYKAGYVDGLNLYLYVRSNPINHQDYSGSVCCFVSLEQSVFLDCACSCDHWITTWEAAHRAAEVARQEAAKIWQRDTPHERALRHCIASAMLTLRVGAECADCIGTRREEYQRTCEGMSDPTNYDYNLGVSYNRMGVLIGLKPTLSPLSEAKQVGYVVSYCKQYVGQHPPRETTGLPTGEDPVTPEDF